MKYALSSKSVAGFHRCTLWVVVERRTHDGRKKDPDSPVDLSVDP